MWHPLVFLRRRRRSDADFADEVASHLELEADRLVAEGLSPEEAAHEARRRFGNVGLAREAFHRRRTIGWIETVRQHLWLAARRLRRAPVFAATVALTLMLGIGATTAVFSLVDGVLLRPLPFADPSRLVDLSHTMVLQGISRVDQSDATYLYYRRANHVFTDVGAYRLMPVNLGGLRDPAGARRVTAARLSANMFHLLGIAPREGRAFREDEDLPGTPPVVILGAGLWQSRYGSDPHIIGRTVMIDGVAHEVVGIMPPRFTFPDDRTALWLPIRIDPARIHSAMFDFRAVARLRRGVTVAEAEADLDILLPRVPLAFPGRLTVGAIELTHMRALVRPLRDVMVGRVGRSLWVILGAATFLLLVACANVAGLFLVRTEARQHDLVIRRALGARPAAIVAETVWEGLLLALLGCALGLALAGAGLGALRSTAAASTIPRLAGVRLNGAVLAAAMGITLLAALLTSVGPALHTAGADAAAVLRQTSRGATAGRRRLRARRTFVVIQLALALVLVTGAGLMARSFRRLRSVPPGFNATRAYTFRVTLPEADYPTTAEALNLVTAALERLAGLPGVTAVGVVSKLPLDGEARRDTAVFVEDRPLTMGQMPNVHQVIYASPGAFGALGIPLLQGRSFAPPDPARTRLDVIVTHALAARYWRQGQAVGKRLRLAPGGPLFTVVGVTGDVRGSGLDQPAEETVYLPLVTARGPAAPDGAASGPRWMPRDLAFVVRGAGTPGAVDAAVERTLRALAPAIPVYGVRTMGEILARSTARTSFTRDLLELASLAALLIGAVGLYGVVSYTVSLQTREMAVRLALGARPGALRRQVLRQAVAVAALGVAVGLAAAVILARFLAALLFDVAPTDAVTLLGAVALMLVVALTASWLPARRAAAIDLASALRPDV